MASCSRNRQFPPSLFGNWITVNRPSWAGDIHLNYNHQAPFWALYSSNRVELILVPGVAFDLQGSRLGRGNGYYDQLLAIVWGKRCGVAFDEQLVPEIPVEAHDARMDCLLTPTRWVELPA